MITPIMESRLNGLRSLCVAWLLLAATVEVLGQSPIDLTGSRRRATGAPVAPVFEGWEPNPDGTFSLYFGYQNRNWEEAVDIAVGPSNFFSPGSQDRGQPTHFLVNRQKRVFTVIVPKDFGNQTLVWTLISRGSTETVPGKLSPLLRVEATRNADYAAPKMNLGSDQTITFPQPATLTAAITSGREDTGLANAGGRGRGGRGARAQRLTIKWRKYRGPGSVTFSDAAPPVKDGQAVTNATFSEPGVYMVQAVADEGSSSDSAQSGGIPGFLCCWSYSQVTITVRRASTRP
jgi:hypothetical protein